MRAHRTGASRPRTYRQRLQPSQLVRSKPADHTWPHVALQLALAMGDDAQAQRLRLVIKSMEADD